MSTTTKQIKRYVAIARALGALSRCNASNNAEWVGKHAAAIRELCDDAPSGSGFDNGSQLDEGNSSGERLFFNTSFHHMDDGGYYDGWTQHVVTVKPSLEHGFELSVSGRDRNDIKELIHSEFMEFLNADVDEWTGYHAETTAAVAS